MIQEDKELLLKDLCARFLYGVKVLYEGHVKEIQYIEPLYNELKLLDDSNYTVGIEEIKPYLRPMSSMTEEEYNEMFQQLYSAQDEFFRNCNNTDTISKNITYDMVRYDWLNKNMFDYRGLIRMGLALEAPEGMYNN